MLTPKQGEEGGTICQCDQGTVLTPSTEDAGINPMPMRPRNNYTEKMIARTWNKDSKVEKGQIYRLARD